MNVEQFVMAYKVEQDRIRAMMPKGYSSLRPVLRINGEIRKTEEGEDVYLEYNTPVEGFGKRGWLNIDYWSSKKDGLSYIRDDNSVTFNCPVLTITYSGVGVIGGCPAEKDNDGCFYLNQEEGFVRAEKIDSPKEYCNCRFQWKFEEGDAFGISVGETTMPAYYEESVHEYVPIDLTAENAAKIPCLQILGAYKVDFAREKEIPYIFL